MNCVWNWKLRLRFVALQQASLPSFLEDLSIILNILWKFSQCQSCFIRQKCWHHPYHTKDNSRHQLTILILWSWLPGSEHCVHGPVETWILQLHHVTAGKQGCKLFLASKFYLNLMKMLVFQRNLWLGIYRDKTMNEKLMYIPNEAKQN